MKLGERLLLVKSWSRPLQRQRRRLFSQTSAGIAEADDIKDALGMSTEACQRLLEEGGFEQYRSLQAYQFLHHTKGTRWADAIGLPRGLRQWLEARAPIRHGRILSRQQSSDGTRKYLIEVAPTKVVETVLIPEADRATLCVSSQVGCSLRCSFCHTGTQKFAANLSAAEILRQYFALPEGIRAMVTNFVFMGQGEPLYNFANVVSAVATITHPKGMAFGRGKVTISTSGIAPLIPKIATELGVNLAVSLHAPNEELRTRIMAINKTFSIQTLMAACRTFIEHASCATRRVSFEYVMLKDVNDRPSHARELARLVKHLPSHINLIPFNAWPGAAYSCSDPADIEAFKAILESWGIPVTVRRTRGQDIMAACGQLKSSLESKMASSAQAAF